MKTTKVFSKILQNHKAEIQILQGGTRSSKTYSILQYFWLLANQSKIPLLFSIISESLPHLKRGAYRDFIDILGEDYNPAAMNKSDMIYHEGLSTIEFFSADQPAKLRGSSRDFLFINECNNVPKSAYDQLEPRTSRKIFLDFNPVEQFWAHDLIGQPGVSFDVSTYKDNPYLEERIIRSIENRKDRDKNWWRVYGEGQIGKIEGLIFPDFELIDELPKDMHTDCGLDFGFTNDPTAMVEVGFRSDAIWINELIYETGLTNQDISKRFKKMGLSKNTFVYADNAEPKSIEEIWREGYNIKPCIKGKDSENIGIDYIKRYKIKVTKNSLNVIKEFRSASWDMDKNGKYLNVMADCLNHTIDACRYAVSGKITPPQKIEFGNFKA